MICPICKAEFADAQLPSRPFCSQRCRLIDLGSWLDDKYRASTEEDEMLASTEGDDTSD